MKNTRFVGRLTRLVVMIRRGVRRDRDICGRSQLTDMTQEK